MDEAALLLRIRVVVGSTRAAAKSLRTDDAQLAGVLERGRRLLDDMAPQIERDGSAAVRERFARARGELDELDGA
jgi:hypothetical protein